MSILKRQRELKKNEKAARKRAKRLGLPMDQPEEPRPTISAAQLAGEPAAEETDAAADPADDGPEGPPDDDGTPTP